jgi:BNR/Asp-box repeat
MKIFTIHQKLLKKNRENPIQGFSSFNLHYVEVKSNNNLEKVKKPISTRSTAQLLIIVYSLITFLIALSGCKDNSVSPQEDLADTTWVQSQGLPSSWITGFGASGNNILAGTYNRALSEAYIYISNDNGYNWHLDSTFHVKSISPDTHLYIGTPVIFFDGEGYLLAGIQGGFSQGTIYISTNNGVSWSNERVSWPKADSSFGSENVNDFTAIGENIYAGTNVGVYSSADYGINWAAVNNGLNYDDYDSTYHHAPQVLRVAAVGENLFAGTSGGGVFESSNGGESWAAMNSGLSSLSIYGLTVIESDLFCGVFPLGSDSIGGVFLYDTNQQQWKKMNNGLTDHTVNVLANGEGYLFCGTNSGLFISANKGQSWKYCSIGTPPQSLAVISLAVINLHLYVGTLHGGWRYPLSEITKLIQKKK